MNEVERKSYIGYAELESCYGIKKGTAYSLVNQHRIPHVRLGKRYVLFSREQIEDWISRHSIPLNGFVASKKS